MCHQVSLSHQPYCLDVSVCSFFRLCLLPVTVAVSTLQIWWGSRLLFISVAQIRFIKNVFQSNLSGVNNIQLYQCVYVYIYTPQNARFLKHRVCATSIPCTGGSRARLSAFPEAAGRDGTRASQGWFSQAVLTGKVTDHHLNAVKPGNFLSSES